MSALRPNGLRSPSNSHDDLTGFPSLKKALSASSNSNLNVTSRAVSPSKARSRSPRPWLAEEIAQDDQESPTTSKLDHAGPLNISIPKIPRAAEAALTAMKYLPTPLIVLSSLKTVVLANEAMGRLMGLESVDKAEDAGDADESTTDEDAPNTDMLRGQSLSQLGIDMVADGSRSWVSWDIFLEDIANQHDPKLQQAKASPGETDTGPTKNPTSSVSPPRKVPDSFSSIKTGKHQNSAKTKSRSLVHDYVVPVILSSPYMESGNMSSTKSTKSSGSDSQIAAKMIVSIWTLDGQRYFTLSFTHSASMNPPVHSRQTHSRTSSRTPILSPTSQRSHPPSPNSPGICPSCGSIPSSSHTSSPTGYPMTVSPFPPMGPPGKADASGAPAIIHKLSRMKDAIINSMDIPLIAMWKDESVCIPNKAARALMYKKSDPTNEDSYDVISRFSVYDENFEHELEPDEYPIIRLVRNQQPFKAWKVGMMGRKGERSTWEASGEGIHDEKTGEFLGGIVALKDVTKYDQIIKTQNEESEQQFQLICETMPQMLWTTTPDGAHDWFSKRWYDYTGLTVQKSIGLGWQNPFHPEDMELTEERWAHSLATGDEYTTEYRCQRHDGEWRWMLGRALPLKDQKTGKILKWFGSCTDIHELVEARRAAKETREQLLNVIKHAKVTVWAIDCSRILTFLEGKLMSDEDPDASDDRDAIGQNIYEVFAHSDADLSGYKTAIEKILDGEAQEQESEHHIESKNRWFRTRFIPVMGRKGDGGTMDAHFIAGVIGISFDTTEMKQREIALDLRKKENARLLSAESAAKEASQLKSQFLANMSHEIRTPIAGVIGMSELLIDTDLDTEQKECAENIQRSANGLLTVINDILDLSKVESGHLDIEEVQFSLTVVINDVCKMLSFAAERKNLDFKNEVGTGFESDLIVLGDPGRVRQILTNLLTNSIKFTSEGFVKLAVKVKEESNESISIAFAVEDTGIGIEEDVRRRLFKPFSQADSSTARRFGGTGLGLTICKNLVDLMHGRITLESELGRGTKATFWIPFNKPQFTGRTSPLVDLGSIPERLQSEMSMSGCPSDIRSVSGTPPMSPMDQAGLPSDRVPRRQNSTLSNTPVSSSDTSELDRKSIHVLVVEDNAINQQIAIKTIRKFGFSVSAVWNGREALDYLLLPLSASTPKPDIILMDVQMPILDGYRATHLIRHHSPYSSIASIRNLPIVAMTASAIQGDKEKCRKAGMDDYLAKPVKGKTLENMLLKWAVEGKRASRIHEPVDTHDGNDHDPNCIDDDIPPLSKTPSSTNGGQIPITTIKPAAGISRTDSGDPRFTRSSVSTSSSGQQQKRDDAVKANLPGTGNEGDRGLQRVEAEEKATSLRDDKLLAASDSSHFTTHHQQQPSSKNTSPVLPRALLTEENITRLGQQNDRASVFADGSKNHNKKLGDAQNYSDEERGSLVVGASGLHSRQSSAELDTVGSLHSLTVDGETPGASGGRRSMRGWLARHESDRSQVTIRQGDIGGHAGRTGLSEGTRTISGDSGGVVKMGVVADGTVDEERSGNGSEGSGDEEDREEEVGDGSRHD